MGNQIYFDFPLAILKAGERARKTAQISQSILPLPGLVDQMDTPLIPYHLCGVAASPHS